MFKLLYPSKLLITSQSCVVGQILGFPKDILFHNQAITLTLFPEWGFKFTSTDCKQFRWVCFSISLKTSIFPLTVTFFLCCFSNDVCPRLYALLVFVERPC